METTCLCFPQEPPSQLASKNLKDKHHLEGIKPWSEDCQAPDTESSGSSNPYSSFQLHSGDAADSPHTHEAGSSSSKVNIHLDHDLESQDDHEMKVSNQEMAPAVIHKAMEELTVDGEKPEDNKLVQIISEDQSIGKTKFKANNIEVPRENAFHLGSRERWPRRGAQLEGSLPDSRG
ncbi:ral guanine nucleotide dissociation stimulator-like [Dasypus novemcinctus]|uniref:ral guanine nucleotide dissociation stimulator-like n=1 Tax=Dasypus novemcinctus TaxID=9361 RepID=UPI00265D78F9|nr:ral guanine nucleotide dissociation stimulator-like isoform X2 [Dasypus novemcinctus]